MNFRTAMLFLAIATGTAAMFTLQGCTVNAVMLDGVNVDASTNPYNYIEAALPDALPAYDCDFAPAADVCQ